MMERKWEKDVLPLCKELGIGFVAFAPMGNGFLSGKYHSGDHFQKGDLRNVITRFSAENMEANQPLLDLIGQYSEKSTALPRRSASPGIWSVGILSYPSPVCAGKNGSPRIWAPPTLS